MMRDPDLKPLERARYSELLGKSEADFTEKHEVKGEYTLLELIRDTQAEEKKLPSPPPPLGEPR